mgnify:CR=1 FL=1
MVTQNISRTFGVISVVWSVQGICLDLVSRQKSVNHFIFIFVPDTDDYARVALPVMEGADGRVLGGDDDSRESSDGESVIESDDRQLDIS